MVRSSNSPLIRAHLVRVEIKLKGQAPYTARLEGSEVVVDFPDAP